MGTLIVQLQARRALTLPRVYQRLSTSKSIMPVKQKSFSCTRNGWVEQLNEGRTLTNYYNGLAIPLGPKTVAFSKSKFWDRPIFNRFRTYVDSTPWSLSLAICTFKATAADYIAQKYVEGRENIDFRRMGLFFAFGFVYSGTINHILYTKVFPHLFPVRTVLNTLRMTSFDNFVNTPFIFFPILYVLKECIISRGTMEHAYEKYKTELWDCCKESWYFWIPGHCVTFGMLPVSMRVPFANFIAFFYYVNVSMQQARFDADRLITLEEIIPEDGLLSLEKTVQSGTYKVAT